MAHISDIGKLIPDSKETIGIQLDTFTTEHKLRPLRDRLNIGLNEVAVLAFEKTREKVRALCEKMAGDAEKSEELYKELVGMCVDVQQAGPWDYAPELNDPKSETARLWQILTFAITREFKKDDGTILKSGNDKVLNDREFLADIDRIIGNLEQAATDPEKFFQEARAAILNGVDQFGVRLESFAQRDKKSGRGDTKQIPEKILKGKEVKDTEWDTAAFVPIADNFGGFMTMAIKGAEVGIVKSDDGEVFVGARGTIDNNLIESCGLVAEEKEEYDRPGSTRKITYFRPVGSPKDNKHDVIKKVHGGFLVVLTRNLDLAKSIAEAVAHKREAVQIAKETLGHTRVIQTSEAKRDGQEISDEENWQRKASFMLPKIRAVHEGTSGEKALVRQTDAFYQDLWHIRGKFVYLDALEGLTLKRNSKGEKVNEQDKEELIKSVAEKMWQKVEEIKYINELIDADLSALPKEIDRVIDMAGGAGDVGLGVSTELFVRGRPIKHLEVVDPQNGVDRFMRTIIANLPPGIRTHLEQVAHHALEHGTGYLQDAEITPTSVVVAKHACGTLTDDIIKQWASSESKLLIAMTCCQDKACGHPARYGFSQEEWDRLTTETGWTNLGDEIARSSGNKKEQLVAKLEKGKKAMQTLDEARVEYLRRHGFKAELHMTDKFPKGDVIIARRLPKNFEAKLTELKQLKKGYPVRFDTLMLRLDKMASGGDVRGLRKEFGTEWIDDDFKELTRRFEIKAQQMEEIKQKIDPKAEQEQKEVSIFGTKLTDYLRTLGVPDGRPFGQALALAKKRMIELKDATPEEIIAAVEQVAGLYREQK